MFIFMRKLSLALLFQCHRITEKTNISRPIHGWQSLEQNQFQNLPMDSQAVVASSYQAGSPREKHVRPSFPASSSPDPGEASWRRLSPPVIPPPQSGRSSFLVVNFPPVRARRRNSGETRYRSSPYASARFFSTSSTTGRPIASAHSSGPSG